MKQYIRCVRLSGIKKPFLLFGTLVCLAALLVSPRMLAGDPQSAFDANNGQEDGREHEGLPPVYNPYPPGILPPDLDSELRRVLREVDFIESRALARWHSLEPPTLTGQPPILQNTGTEAVEALGELMNYDKNISPGRNQACASCHMPYVAFSGPIPSVNLTMIAYPGTEHFRVQAECTTIPVCPVLPCTPVQRRTATFLWRKLLGFTRDWISVKKSGRPSGTGVLPSILKKWAIRILLASPSSSPRLRTDRSLN